MNIESIFCHSCGTKILKSSTFCNGCGVKQQFEVTEGKSISDSIIKSDEPPKKPFYKKWWFITLTIILLLNLIISFNSVKCINTLSIYFALTISRKVLWWKMAN